MTKQGRMEDVICHAFAVGSDEDISTFGGMSRLASKAVHTYLGAPGELKEGCVGKAIRRLNAALALSNPTRRDERMMEALRLLRGEEVS